jgi:hypothetical protein
MLHPKTERRDRIFLEIDQSLSTLNWDLNTARGYLKEQFNCVSRHQLDDLQLDQLNRQLDYKASLVKPTK